MEYVSFDGYQDDMPAYFSKYDIVLSCSDREGTHESVLQAMAAGCIPLIRDWPLVKRFGGASTLYPSEYVISDASSAVDIVNRIKSSPDGFQSASEGARAFVLSRYDKTIVLPQYEKILAGDMAP